MTTNLAPVAAAIRLASAGGALRNVARPACQGYSGEKLIGTLQRLAALVPADIGCYLEIGVFQGLTLLSVAAAVPQLRCLGIDNSSLAGSDLATAERLRRELGLSNAAIIAEDYETVFANASRHLDKRQIGLLFVDGPHDYRSQRMCLELALPFLHEHAVIVVDDANYAHVRQADRDFLVTQPEFRLVFEAYTPAHPQNLDAAGAAAAREGWWNGVHVIARAAGSSIPRAYPPVPSTERFALDHLVHGSGAGPFLPRLLVLAESLLAARRAPGTALRVLAGLVRQRWREGGLLPPHPRRNTYSEGLSPTRFHVDD
jgi:predicted O-methyltransferase YrrM